MTPLDATIDVLASLAVLAMVWAILFIAYVGWGR
jgi:hypothetical protein